MMAINFTRVLAGDGGGSALFLWAVSILLLLTAVFPYFLGATLIETEVFAAQPFLRLILALFACVFAVLAMMWQKPLVALVALLATLVLFGQTWATMGWSIGADLPPQRAGYLHVYSQNIGMDSPEEFIGLIAQGDFDLILLQEVYVGHKKGWEVLADKLGYHFNFQILRRDAGMGGFFMSKYPMTVLPPLRTRSWARHIRYLPRVQILYVKVPIDIYNVHLESLPLVEGSRMLFGSSRLRRQQAELLAREIAAAGHPVILGGDLNSTPLYYSNRPLLDLLTDSWAEAGWGFGFTYHASLPFARIDYVLHRGFRTVIAEVVDIAASDHRGLHVVLEPAR